MSSTSGIELFEEGRNCWRRSRATYMAPLIDCANFYKALHESICRAQHSIFIVGWDIDSRIKLLRGSDAERAEMPVVISDLLREKTKRNPNLKVYLLRWDPSLSFFGLREKWMHEAWEEKTDDEVNVCLDDSVPMGGCQHQKIVVIDDEIAFSGGMDVTVRRWDTRDHPVVSAEREDEGGKYGPFHDVQCVVSGPVVAEYAELARWRWNRIAKVQAAAFDDAHVVDGEKPRTWPKSFPPVIEDIPCAIARTLPELDDEEPVQEVKAMFEDLVDQAEQFIYVENQFATYMPFAEHFNARLRERDDLKLLFLSSYRPEGLMEREAYWATRIEFRDRVQEGIRDDRAHLVYSSAVDEDGNFGAKRVHAKVMVIDDDYLVIGSSNISNRSMSLDTECDLVFAAETDEHRRKIAFIRNDLIAEHCGHSVRHINSAIEQGEPLSAILQPKTGHCYRMHDTEDEQFTDQTLREVLLPLSDPDEPMVPTVNLTNGKKLVIKNPKRKSLILGGAVLAITLLVGLLWLAHHYIPWMQPDQLKTLMEDVRDTPWALPVIVGIYLLAGLLFFPVTVLSVAVAAVFGPIWGPVYGMFGVVASSALLFGIGQLIGDRGLRKLAGHRVQVVDEKIKDSGVVGVAAIRLIPVAPFSLVNLVAGISSLHISTFLLGTFFGMLPPMIAKGLVGDSITQILKNPSPTTIAYLLSGIVIWVLAIVFSQKLVKYMQRRKQGAAAAATS